VFSTAFELRGVDLPYFHAGKTPFFMPGNKVFEKMFFVKKVILLKIYELWMLFGSPAGSVYNRVASVVCWHGTFCNRWSY
jgi:hypothetical protein